jgi:hypothetical protein
MLEEQLHKSSDQNYRIMTEGKIRIAKEDYENRMGKLQESKTKADILFEVLAFGILVIC